VLRLSDPRGGRYAGIALRADRVAAAPVIGMPDPAAALVQFHDSGFLAPLDRLGLLLGRTLPDMPAGRPDASELPGSALVCRCNGVTKDALLSAVRDGSADLPGLSRATRAGTGRGGCRDAVSKIAAWAAATPARV